MPTAIWYCENIGNSTLPYVLLTLPLAGAYLYGQKKQRLAWILIGAWVVLEIAMTTTTSIYCVG
ncbi:hypothetical protein [Methylosinus sp. Sm6]|uniref:hypothetical protein n=1 Tax=Methylosinus sp. Sm6 TaxID=2866948 RepID=UPI001C99DBD1|nr:hypothetical protein [Methylosinus sp. Sm6]MBY6241195.1 hypothetical protein [Methylosinus sp. Sm6]